MSDQGFAEPDPAPIPGEDQSLDDLTVIGEDVSCRNCSHFEVCAYYAGIQPMLEQRENAPIDAADLAVICDAFKPVAE